MDDDRKATELNPVATDLGKWMWRIVVAVILGEAIWGFLVAITNDLILPLITKMIGGGRPINVPGMFGSVIELCLASTVAILLNSWFTKSVNSRAKATLGGISTPVPAPTADRNAASTTIALAAAAPANAPATKVNSVPTPAFPPPKPPKREKTEPQKKVYYNIVGEPIDSDED